MTVDRDGNTHCQDLEDHRLARAVLLIVVMVLFTTHFGVLISPAPAGGVKVQ